MKHQKLAIITALGLAACNAQHPKVSAIAQPAAIIKGSTSETIIGKVSDVCDRYGYRISETTKTSVVCSKDASLVMTALLATKYGNMPQQKIRFNSFRINASSIKVIGNSWFENQNAFGQTGTNDYKGESDIQAILDQVQHELGGKQ